jgi:H+/gluconate symporter-like permease
MSGWKESLTSRDSLTETGTIFAGEVVSSIGAIFITPLLDTFLHKKDNPIRKKVADWVEPHVKEIEQSSFHKELHALGEEEGKKEEQSYHTLSKRGRAERIADILIEGGSLFLSDNVINVAVQALLKRLVPRLRDNKEFKPFFNGMIGVTAHLGCIALFGTILEKPTEWIYRKLAAILQKVGGMKEDEALRAASSMTFIAGPGLVAFLTETLVNSRPGRGK